jgi:dihydrofolate reductase
VTARPRLSLVVAQGRNRVIGADGALPWRQKTDMRHFKAATIGKPVVMGRKTWNSLKGPLKGRDNIVLTRRGDVNAPGAWTFASLDAALACALARAMARGVDEVCVIGGGDIYRQTLAFADLIRLTEIDAAPEGDATFPELGSAWREREAHVSPAAEGDDHAMRFSVWERQRD